MKKIIEMWSVIMVAIALGGLSMNAGAEEADHFLWLEEVEGERSLAWVREQNAATEAELSQDPRFDTFQAEALELLHVGVRFTISGKTKTIYAACGVNPRFAHSQKGSLSGRCFWMWMRLPPPRMKTGFTRTFNALVDGGRAVWCNCRVAVLTRLSIGSSTRHLENLWKMDFS